MPEPEDRQAFLNLCEMAIDNIYKLAALGGLLEKKALITKQEILALAKDLKQKALPADPSLQRFTAKDGAVMEEFMEIVFHHKLTADQAKRLLSRTLQLVEWGKQAAQEIPQANASPSILSPIPRHFLYSENSVCWLVGRAMA